MAKRKRLNIVTCNQVSGCSSNGEGETTETQHTSEECGDNGQVHVNSSDGETRECEFGQQEETQTEKKTRGAAVMADVWELESNKKIKVELNRYGAPVGDEGATLTRFLGTVARDSRYAPIDFADWRKMPQKTKDDMWELVQKKFSFAPDMAETKRWVLADLNDKWRLWKTSLKSKYFDASKTFDQMVQKLDDGRVDEGQFKLLLTYWLTDGAKKISEINKVNKSKSKDPHTGGTKTFARVIHEETVKSSGTLPSRAAIYIKTRFSSKTGEYVTPEAAEMAEAMKTDLASSSTHPNGDKIPWKEDIYAKHKGPEKKGHVRCMGKMFVNGAESSQQGNGDTRKDIDGLFKVIRCLADAVKEFNPRFNLENMIEEARVNQASTGASGIEKSPSSSNQNNNASL